METISMGTVYAVWTSIGAIGGVAVGIIAFGESASTILCIASAALVVAGIVELKTHCEMIEMNDNRITMFGTGNALAMRCYNTCLVRDWCNALNYDFT
ncbi:MAG: hypothetical protein II649_04395 [Kiritimatiellae bacterium]|nr:hypothetical protein [Kiritimatiellia bacterium]